MVQVNGDYSQEIVSRTPRVKWACGMCRERDEEIAGKTGSWKKFQPALMEWRNTPRVSDGFSPAQWALGRRQRTTCPALPGAYDRINDEDLKQASATTSQEYKNTKENTKVTQYLLVLLIIYYALLVICCELINVSFVKLIA